MLRKLIKTLNINQEKRKQIIRISNERQDIIIDPNYAKRVINEQNEQLYANKLDNLDEMESL